LNLARQGEFKKAIAHYSEALRINPQYAEVHDNLGIALSNEGETEKARAHFREAIRLDPEHTMAHYNLAIALNMQGRIGQAIEQLRQGLRVQPDRPKMAGYLAWILATCENPSYRNGSEAVRLAELAVERAKDSESTFLDTLAAAYAEAGRYDEARKTAQKAIKLARSLGQDDLAEPIEQRLQLYEQDRPYHQHSTP